MSERQLLLLVVAVAIGALVGSLTWAAGAPVPTAVLAGITGFGAALAGLHKFVGT